MGDITDAGTSTQKEYGSISDFKISVIIKIYTCRVIHYYWLIYSKDFATNT